MLAARGRGGRLAVGFRHVLGYYTGWRDSFAQQRARPDFVTETESGDDDYTAGTTTTKRNRCGSPHTYTHTRYTHRDRWGTDTLYWRADTVRDDDDNQARFKK